MNNLHTQAIDFLNDLFKKVDAQVPLSEHWDIDHLCYRTETPQDYEHTKSEFESFSNLLIESPVNGRMISTYKLNQPIYFRQWKIDLIEVPAPKPGKKTPRGFEHIEVVCDADLFLLKENFSLSENKSASHTTSICSKPLGVFLPALGAGTSIRSIFHCLKEIG